MKQSNQVRVGIHYQHRNGVQMLEGHHQLENYLEEMQERIDADKLRKEVQRVGRLKQRRYEEL